MSRTVERTYHHQPVGHGRTQVWFVETTTEETRTYLDTADDIAGILRIEDAHKARQEAQP